MIILSPYHQVALATGLGAGAMVLAATPDSGWEVVLVTALSGYVGGLLPDIDDTVSTQYRVVRALTRLAAVLIPCIQFFYRPTDLVLAIPLAWLMVSTFWWLMGQVMQQRSHAHSLVSALCLSLGVAWAAYMSVGEDVILPAFLASATGYVLHLLLDDIYAGQGVIPVDESKEGETPPDHKPALVVLGRGHPLALTSILLIGLVSCIALWGF